MITHNLLKPYAKPSALLTSQIQPHAAGRSWFKVNELVSLYDIPSPSSENVVVGIVSFGGGLVGTVNANGVLTNGDVQTYWSYLGIAPQNMPTVILKTLNGAVNFPEATDGSTEENTLDVETVGGCCPTSKLTIILYIAPNSFNSFVTVLNYALHTPVVYGNENLTPSIISITWGAPEIYFTNLLAIDELLKQAVSRGINVCVASGDNGSSDGLRGNNVDFPSSSPNVIAVGGTSLVSTANTYSALTVERAWTFGGGGISKYFAKPAYQSNFSGSFRYSPDVALNADPNTGVIFYVKGAYVIYGGTSVSAPTLAGYFASINAKAFANPRFYAASRTCFHDITVGSNGAFNTKTGFDNCTGLGSIVGNQLKDVLNAQVEITSVSITLSGSYSLSVGSTVQAILNLIPTNATATNFVWTSSNIGVATVNSFGLISAVNNGFSQIRATSVQNNSMYANSTVIVTTKVIGVMLNVNTLSISLRTPQYQFIASVSPNTASNKSVTWLSSRTQYVRVSTTGLVTAIAKGSSTIQVTTTDGNFRATCVVTVNA